MITVGGTSQRLGATLRDRGRPSRDDGRAWLPGSVDEILLRRRSVREFASGPLPVSQLQAAATAARNAEAATWPARSHGTSAFEILVAAFRVDGLPKGMFVIRDAGQTRLAGPGAARLDSLRGQYADAPALLLICADLNQACRAAGAAGYPSTLVRAGTMGYAAWLWAISAGLAGSVYGAPSHRVTEVARQLDTNLRHLFTVAIGTPALPVQPLGTGN
jgi:nitroreductase